MIIETAEQAKDTRHVEGVSFRCHQCGEVKPVGTSCGTGYGRNDRDELICYSCCGENDKRDMIEKGRATLYLTCEPASKMRLNGRPYTSETLSHGTGRKSDGKVSNWPGTLSFKCFTRAGRHNIAGTRYDCWFTGPDGKQWHGVTYGDNTQICHCKRLKKSGRLA